MADVAEAARAPINIVLCADGTGNSGGKLRGTNVWRIYEGLGRHGLKDSAGNPISQVAFHDDGVGTEKNKVMKTLGGALGVGLSRNIRDLYAALVKTYQPGDRLYLFGFSRGAYTVRALAGMVCKCGVLKSDARGPKGDLDSAIGQAFKAYRARGTGAAEAFKTAYEPHQGVEIQCIGVWDTVDAVGVPFDWMRDALSGLVNWRFHDSDLNPLVRNGFHAISIDDERQTFDPVMWNEAKKQDGQVIEQVWFAGVHSNVGGGYPREGMASVTLDWMMTKAAACGLRFTSEARNQVRQAANVHAKLYDSRSGPKAFYRYRPRDIAAFSERHTASPPKIHRSVFERIAWQTADYAPAQLPGAIQVVGTENDASDLATISPIQSRLDASVVERTGLLAPIKNIVYWRRRLYEALVTASFLFAGAALALRQDDAYTGTAGAATSPGLWATAKQEAVELAVGLVPSFLESVIRGLFHNLWLVAIAAIVFGGLLMARRHLESSMKRHALEAWRWAKLPRTLV